MTSKNYELPSAPAHFPLEVTAEPDGTCWIAAINDSSHAARLERHDVIRLCDWLIAWLIAKDADE